MILSSGKRFLIVGLALVAAAVACCAPSGQAGCQPPAPAGKTVSAGIKTNFSVPYTIVVAPGWVDTHETDPSRPLDRLTLTKGDYSLAISQTGGGIEACFFGGVPTPEGAAQLWLEFPGGVEIKAVSTKFMRGTTDGVTHRVCQKTDNGFTQSTLFGYISYTTPNPADPAALAEMDGMVATLRQ